MTQHTPKQIIKILADHKKGLADDGGNRANLPGANLTGANLTYADLTKANLTYAIGSNSRMQSLQIDPYKIIVLDKMAAWGGCTKKTAQEWLDYEGIELSKTNRKYLNEITKPFIRMCIGASA